MDISIDGGWGEQGGDENLRWDDESGLWAGGEAPLEENESGWEDEPLDVNYSGLDLEGLFDLPTHEPMHRRARFDDEWE